MGTEIIGPDSYGRHSGEYWAMGASLTQHAAVKEEGFRVVTSFKREGAEKTVLLNKATANTCQQPRVNNVGGRSVVRIYWVKGRVAGVQVRIEIPRLNAELHLKTVLLEC